MSPLYLEVMLLCRYCADPEVFENLSQAKQGALSDLHERDMIESDFDNTWKVTSKGQAFVDYICSVPDPTITYTIQMGGKP